MSWRYRKQRKARDNAAAKDNWQRRPQKSTEERLDSMAERALRDDELDTKFGFDRMAGGAPRLGWLLNMNPTTITKQDDGVRQSALDLYFIGEDGHTFKATVTHRPYFYLGIREPVSAHFEEVEAYVRRRFEGAVVEVRRVDKEDLDLKNHLSGLQRTYMRVEFNTVQALVAARSELAPLIEANRAKDSVRDIYGGGGGGGSVSNVARHSSSISSFFTRAGDEYGDGDDDDAADAGLGTATVATDDCSEYLVDIRESDVRYYERTAIDLDIRVGHWYDVNVLNGRTELTHRAELEERPDCKVCAFDIETTKQPLRFPDARTDEIMMISYMLDEQGYLIINRAIVADDIADFEYTPKPEYVGKFKVMNVADERALLDTWFAHMREFLPHIYVTFNGDFFDWPFVRDRARHHGLDMFDEIGVREDREEFRSRFASHMDAFRWVQRDSYLPQGSQGLKAVTRKKLGYDPLALDPEQMLPLAKSDPQRLANYSVSDAVATYYLYMKYVHPFIFSLCVIVPMNPDDVLRKGSGTLCESLLMVEATRANVIYPTKQQSSFENFYEGHFLESQTYVGGHVEALRSGVFRSDLPVNFALNPDAFKRLADEVDDTLRFAIEVDEKKRGVRVEDVDNYEELRAAIVEKLMDMRARPNRREVPTIYHLDVSAMYPNIILTNRLQPTAIVSDEMCAACDFNKPGKTCQREMHWTWRGDYSPASRAEYNHIVDQLNAETFAPTGGASASAPRLTFGQLPKERREALVKERLKAYSAGVYKKTHETKEVERTAVVCQRENSFYVDTVRAFRDRRYEYKAKVKKWGGALATAKKANDVGEELRAKSMVIIYDSMQLAHKCILNSFYGYVMRRGARWYSMEMAGIVTHTGAQIIKVAKDLVDDIGQGLELDTDGIWCVFPATFPENFEVRATNADGKPVKFVISYPCALLNKETSRKFTNAQYETLDKRSGEYVRSEECTIEFEVDGPYRAMILPAANKLGVGGEVLKLKKRYAVFNFDGSLAELKGFEIKRRGELELIKIFQAQVFDKFLRGATLKECYANVASIADHWIDVLESRGADMEDDELLELISEASNMSKSLVEYGDRKSAAITTARRLAEFLGDSVLSSGKLQCTYVVSKFPSDAPVTARALPVQIFHASTEAGVRHDCLRKWLRTSSLRSYAIRDIIDWDYYRTRLCGAIQKIITIPAFYQGVDNPVPRVAHPDWLPKQRQFEGRGRQQRLTFGVISKEEAAEQQMRDIEDFGREATLDNGGGGGGKAGFARVTKRGGKKRALALPEATDEQLRTPVTPMSESFDDWLEESKLRWRRRRRERKERRRAIEAAERDDSGAAEHLQALLAKQSLRGGTQTTLAPKRGGAVIFNHWEILHVTRNDDDVAGRYTCWTLINGGALHAIQVDVPFRFYVHVTSGSEAAAAGGREVPLRPPRPRAPGRMYEYELPAQTALESSKALSALITNPDVEGVYETSVPLHFRALVELGCVCRVKASARRDGKERHRFRLNELERLPVKSFPYVHNANLRRAYLYHSYAGDRQGKVGVLGVFVPNADGYVCTVVYIVPQRYELSVNAQTKALTERYGAFGVSSVFGSTDEAHVRDATIAYDVRRATSLENALNRVNRVLEAYRSERRGATVVCVQSTRPVALLTKQCRALRDFPLMMLKENAGDNVYELFNWEFRAAAIMCERFAHLDAACAAQLAYARYAGVPLCNVQEDGFLTQLTDVLYARRLRAAHYVLWVSETSRPDFGGSEDDEQGLFGALDYPEICEPGAYEKACVELDIVGLCVDTVLEANHVLDVEGSSALLQFGTKETGAAYGTSAVLGQFKVLRALVTELGFDIDKDESLSHVIEMLLAHLPLYVANTRAKLHDPGLHRMVHRLMCKVFMQLVAELRKLGTTVVFANFTRLILATGKSSAADARAYVDNVLAALRKKELFAWLDIQPSVRTTTPFWQQLVFLDRHNLGGVPVPEPRAAAVAKVHHDDGMSSDDDEVEEEAARVDEQMAQHEFTLVSHWDISAFLPERERDGFSIIFLDFLLHRHRLRLQEHAAAGDVAAQRVLRHSSHLQRTESMAQLAAAERERSKDDEAKVPLLERSYFQQKLMSMVEELTRGPPSHDVDERVAVRRRDQSKEVNVPLEFVKTVCAVLALDRSSSIDALRRALLRMLDVREFDPRARFVNPSLAYVLPGVICAHCFDEIDIDLLRDPLVLSGADWACHKCNHLYDRAAIERRLVDEVHRCTVQYQLQDLRCKKCKLVQAETLSTTCGACTAPMQTKRRAEEPQRLLKVMGAIARLHRFEWLLEVVDTFVEA